MQYRAFGATGCRVSALGFGAMRLPMRPTPGGEAVDEDLAIPMFHRAFQLGVNYVDTAYMYCRDQSESVVGRAVRGRRDSLLISTKLPVDRVSGPDDFWRIVEDQVARLGTYIDFYHFHGLSMDKWAGKVLPLKLLELMDRARDRGLIRNLSFSFHDKPEAMRTFVDAGVFASVLCQYNFLDRANEDALGYAASRGLGVVVMGPVGGGRLGSPKEYLDGVAGGRRSTPELALRFVLANPAVSCALSGMSTLEQVEQNCATAADLHPLEAEESRQLADVLAERKQLADLYCTGCGYCMPCPHDVNIPLCFECMINHRVYGMTEHALKRYRAIGDQWLKGKRADACVECGVCESKCPQKIPIRRQLKEVAAVLGPMIGGAS